MMPAAPREALPIASRVAQTLARAFPSVEAVCVFGSVARHEDTAASDLDLLVAGLDPELGARTLKSALPDELRARHLSLSYYTLSDLESLFSSGASFLIHIRTEGNIVFDRNGKLEQ